MIDESWGNSVGEEARKNFSRWLRDGFIEKYLSGQHVLDIGFAGYLEGVTPITPDAIGIDLEYPGYDGKTLPFQDGSQDAVFISHCLEHIEDYRTVLADWFRVLRVGGHMIITVPHQYLYERKLNLPSRFNMDHRRFYTPASLLREVEESIDPMSYRIRSLSDNDADFDYDIVPEEHATGCYEIILVLQKINVPRYADSILAPPTIRRESLGTFVPFPRPAPNSPVHCIATGQSVESVIVFKLDHLGDFILAMSPLHKLRSAFPGAALTLVCGPWNADAAKQMDIFDEVIEFSLFERNPVQNGLEPREARLRQLRHKIGNRQFDLAIDLRVDNDTRDVLKEINAHTKAGFGWPGDFDFLDISFPAHSPTATGRAGVWLFDARRFHAVNGVNDGMQIELPSGCYREGENLIYGPYCDLLAADYRMKFHVLDDLGATPEFNFDIVCNGGNLLLAQGALADAKAEIEFRLLEPVRDLEMRLFGSGNETRRVNFQGCTIYKSGVTVGPHQTELMAMLVALLEQRMVHVPKIAHAV